MIKVNGDVVECSRFPDGTLNIKDHLATPCNDIWITWHYENDAEMFAIMCLTRHYQNINFDVYLVMPYIPNARMDRVQNPEDIFTLKYFAEFINSLNFKRVYVLDPHSNVSAALINNIRIEENDAQAAYREILSESRKNNRHTIVFFPDEGSMKRYSSDFNVPYAFGVKKRNWETGEIEGLEVIGGDKVDGADILIVDDICSKGGTFYHSAKKLKELGANNIYLYVTHCEPTILDGEIFKSGLITKVFTTNTIFNEVAQARAKELGVANKIEVENYD